jgi:hypothetical protein
MLMYFCVKEEFLWVNALKGVKLPVGWVEKAEVFLREARRHLGEGIYRLACLSNWSPPIHT